MTDRQLDSTFDREIRALFEAGPRAAPTATLERALARAEAVAQRRPQFARLDRDAWPPQGRFGGGRSVDRLALLARHARLALAALLIAVVGAVIAVGAGLVDRRPAETPTPSLTKPSLTVRVASAGTFTNRLRDHLPARLWPDGRVLIGEEYLVDLATGASETLAVVLEPGPSPSVSPLADGRVVLIYDKDIEGVITEGQHAVAILDPASGAVTEVGRLPAYAHEQRLVLHDGRIFGSGGFVFDELGPGAVLDTAYIFDIETGTTTNLAPLRQPRSSHVMVDLLDGRVLLIGGEPPETEQFPGPLAWVEVYDLATGTSTPVEGPGAEDDWGWGSMYPFTRLADGPVVLPGGATYTEPCGFFPRPSGGIVGGLSERAFTRDQPYVLDPATGSVRAGPLIPPTQYAYVPLDGDRALISRHEKAFASCDVDSTRVNYAWLGIVDFGSGTVLGSPNPLTGEGELDVRPEAVYMSGVRLPDGRVAVIEAPGLTPGPSRVDVLTIGP